jgi:hypothetical protein
VFLHPVVYSIGQIVSCRWSQAVWKNDTTYTFPTLWYGLQLICRVLYREEEWAACITFAVLLKQKDTS